ncbi:MAG: hypothetical protein ACYCQI_08195 [Gammaproteobacteria bacterium]
MKKLLKALTGLLLCGAMAGSVVASEGYYGAPKALNANSPKFSRVVLTNYTWDTYDTYAEFQPTFSHLNLVLGRSGSGRHQITYDIHSPDQVVCLNVVRQFDRVNVYSGCLVSGGINIGPYAANNKLPTVTVTK